MNKSVVIRADRWPPAQQCAGTSTRSGAQCRRRAIRGGRYCPRHGGSLPALRIAAEREVEAARLLLQVRAHEVAEALIALCLDEDQPAYVRVAAQRVALDRAGIGASSDVSLTLAAAESGPSPGEVIRERLQRLAEGLPAEAVGSVPPALEEPSASPESG